MLMLIEKQNHLGAHSGAYRRLAVIGISCWEGRGAGDLAVCITCSLCNFRYGNLEVVKYLVDNSNC